MESSNYEGWLSINEAAQYLNLSVSFLRKQVRCQHIPFARPGGKILRFRRTDLDHWLESSDTALAPEIDAKEKPNELDYARKLLQVLGWPATESNLVLVAEAIVVTARNHEGSKARAFDYLRECVLANQAEGVPIKGSYFRALSGQHTEDR